MIALPRNDLRLKVVKGSEIQEILHSQPNLKSYLLSLYECQYVEFFQKLGEFGYYVKNSLGASCRHQGLAACKLQVPSETLAGPDNCWAGLSTVL